MIKHAAAAAAKSRQLCLTLGDPMDCSLSGSSTHGISQKEYWSGVPLPSRNKSYLWQNRTQYTTQWWNTESLTKIWNKTRMLILTTSIQHSIGSLSHSNHTWKNKRYSNEGEDLTLSLYADMVLYIENPMDSTQKLLVLIHKFSKLAGYKINIQKLVAFLYSNNEISERECK